jgi:hypothetical protein
LLLDSKNAKLAKYAGTMNQHLPASVCSSFFGIRRPLAAYNVVGVVTSTV